MPKTRLSRSTRDGPVSCLQVVRLARIDRHIHAQRHPVRDAAVPDGEWPHRHLQHARRAQFRARQLLHARRLLRIPDQPMVRLLAGAAVGTDPGRRARRCGRALRPAARAQKRPCRRVAVRIPPSLDFPAFTIFSTNYPAYKMFMLLVSIAIFIGLLLVLKKTRVGLIVQAALTHPEMVGHLGHNVGRVFMLVFGVGTALAAVAGVIAGPALVTQSNMAGLLGPILFVVVVVGGLGSLPG